MEAAAKDTLELHGSKESEVNKISNGNDNVPTVKPKPRVHRFRCGGTTHESSQCRKCGKLPTGKGQNFTRRNDEKPNLHSFEVEDERNDDSLVALLEVNNVTQVAAVVIWVTPKINGHTLKMELNTGSAIFTLPLQMNRKKFIDAPLVDTKATPGRR